MGTILHLIEYIPADSPWIYFQVEISRDVFGRIGKS